MKKTFAALVALTATIVPLATAAGQTLTVRVSDTLLGLNQKWAEGYQAGHPAAVIQVTGGSTAAVFATLAESKADLIFVSRAIRYKEAQACEVALGRRPADAKVAVSGLAVYVNTNNPVRVVTYDELEDIFRGKTQNWKELAGGRDQTITVYAPATNSVTGELFNEEVLNGRGFAAGVRLLAGQAVVKAVAADPQGIGFGALTPAEAVQFLSIKRARSSTPVTPTADSIARRIYPVSRYVYSYASPAASPAAIQAYLGWIRSDAGQQAAKDAGFFALPATSRPSQ
jgi:phosphate transport system substrate-binding protein